MSSLRKVHCVNASSTDHLISWIKVNQIKQDLNNDILSDSMACILQLFGSNTDLLQFLVSYSSKEQLDSIYTILQENIQKFKNNDQQKSGTTKPEMQSVQSSNNFNIISQESISHICSFLSRKQIRNLKIVSRRISVVCLQEMQKYSVDICLADKLLNTKETNKLKWANHLSLNRYHNSTVYSLILDNLHKTRDFEQKFQIPIVIAKYGAHQQQIDKSDTIHPNSYLIVFDKRNITILNSSNKQTDSFNLKKQSILILHYFDILK
eukprot:263568_1